MGADIKSLRNRIKSVDSTLHLTNAMGLVASSKIRRANQRMNACRTYADGLTRMIEQLSASPECRKSPYMRVGGTRTRILVIAGDRGLAGGYNANIFRLARTLDADFIPIGKRACDRFGAAVLSSEHFSAADGYRIAKAQCDDFAAGRFDRLGILCTRYVSMLTQEPEIRWVLPLTAPENAPAGSTLFEPDERTILDLAIPEYVSGILIAAVRESFASEVAARRMAMDSAGKNAGAMIDRLSLQYNRARQGAITQEITEIVAGSGN